MAKTEQDGKFAADFTGNKPLDWNRRPDGSLVIITHDGKKVILSPEFLSSYKPKIARAVLTEPDPMSTAQAQADTLSTERGIRRRLAR